MSPTASQVQYWSDSARPSASKPRTGPVRPVSETTPIVAAPESVPLGFVKSSVKSETVSPA